MDRFTLLWTVSIVLQGLIAGVSARCRHGRPPPCATGVSTRHVSMGGETRLTIYGEGFPIPNPLDTSSNVRVNLVGEQTHPAKVSPTEGSENLIIVITPKLPRHGYHYDLEIIIGDHTIDRDTNCWWCDGMARSWRTPTVTALEPYIATPDEIIKTRGRMFTDSYDSSRDPSGKNFRRVYVGSQLCLLKPEDSDEPYGVALDSEDSENGYFKCKITGTYISYFNMSYIIGTYGRSYTANNVMRVSASGKLYSLGTFAVVRSVMPRVGSHCGGTIVNITGRFFDETDVPARVEIGGKKCIVKSISDTEIICQIEALENCNSKPFNHHDNNRTIPAYMGNRGMYMYSASNMKSGAAVPYSLLQELTNITYFQELAAEDLEMTYMQESGRRWDSAEFQDVNGTDVKPHFTTASKAFVCFKESGWYAFRVKSDDVSKVFFSWNGDPADKELYLWCNRYCAGSYYYTDGRGNQQTQRMYFEADKCIYVEIYHNNGGRGPSGLWVGLIKFNTKYTNAQTTQAVNHKQRINLQSTVDKEMQKLTFTRGVSVTLTLAGVTSPSISQDMSEETINTKLLEWRSTKCPSSITSPSNKAFFNDFENTNLCSVCGTRSQEVGAFCGLNAVKNPTYFYHRAHDGRLSDINIATYSKLCFSYYGPLPNEYEISFYSTDGSESTAWRTATFSGLNTGSGWRYHCEDIFEAANTLKKEATVSSKLRLDALRVRLDSEAGVDVYIDTVYVGANAPNDYTSVENSVTWGPRPGGEPLRALTATVSGQVINVTVDSYNCASNLPLITASPGNAMTVERLKSASPPVTGTFTVSFNGYNKTGIPSNIDPKLLEAMLNTIPDLGEVKVTREGDCYGYKYIIAWVGEGGYRETGMVYSESISGRDATVGLSLYVAGGLYYEFIPDDYLRTHHELPQATVDINDIPSRADGDCSFEFKDDNTPTITDVQPTTGTSGDTLTVDGSMFDGVVGSPTSVMLGDYMCDVTANSANQIVCTIPEAPRGMAKVVVYVDNLGYADATNTSVDFTFTGAVSGIEPVQGGVGGGYNLTITGHGFDKKDKVMLGNMMCEIEDISYGTIKCTVPSKDSGGEVEVSVVSPMGSQYNLMSATNFTYTAQSTPVVTALNVTSRKVIGDVSLLISGSHFGDSAPADTRLTICRQDDMEDCRPIELVEYSNTTITVILPEHEVGRVVLRLLLGNLGYADVSGVSAIQYDLTVTNIYPTTGSVLGGTLVTVTGTGFPTSLDGFKVSFGESVLVIDESTLTETQFVGKTSAGATKHNVTNSGNNVDMTAGAGYGWEPKNLEVLVGDTVRWCWQGPVAAAKFMVKQRQSESDSNEVAGGFSSGAPTNKGCFEYLFSAVGSFHYWSGYYDAGLSMQGSVYVRDMVAMPAPLNVALKNFEADVQPGGANPSASWSCSPVESGFSGCTDNVNSSALDSGRLYFTYSPCYTPTVTAITPVTDPYVVVTAQDTITLTGTGFSTTACNDIITIGEWTGVIEGSPTETSLTFKLDPGTTMEVGSLNPWNLRISNLGNALTKITNPGNLMMSLLPSITSISPEAGSTQGGTILTIEGIALLQNNNPGGTTVRIGDALCMPLDPPVITYNQIKCKSNVPVTSGSNDVTVRVQYGDASNYIGATCKTGSGTCTFSYASDQTPTVTGVAPDTASGANTLLTFSGTKFGGNAGDLTVMVGSTACSSVSITNTDTEFTCNVAYLPYGTHSVVVVNGLGKASGTVTVMGGADITAITPQVGSIYGGLRVTIDGFGFVPGETTVTFGSFMCTDAEVTTSSIVCTSPAVSTEDSLTVSVTTGPSSEQTVLTGDFNTSLTQTPMINDVSPLSGGTDDVITITGSGFGTVVDDVMVYIGGKECMVTGVSEGEINCTAPALLPHTHQVVVNQKNQGKSGPQDMKANFTAVFEVDSFTPTSGSLGGGQTLTVLGSGFWENHTKVDICDEMCLIVAVAPGTITCKTPFLGQSDSAVVCNLTVTIEEDPTDSNTDTSQIQAAGAFTVDPGLTAEVTGFSPTRGGTGGGTILTINGTNFGDSGNVVTIADLPCTVLNETSTEIVCRTSPSIGRTHKAPVEVFVPDRGYALQVIDHSRDTEFFYVDRWSSIYTWGGKQENVPIEGDYVVIKEGQTILLDTDTPVLWLLVIQGGTLVFDDKDIHLQAQYILIEDGGVMQIGTEEEPFKSQATVTMHGSILSTELPIYGAKVLAVRHGRLDMHGIAMEPTWTELAVTADAGATSITLEEAVNWPVGAKIVLATTSHRHSQSENEVATIASVSGSTITLEEPLKYKHISVTETFDGLKVYTRGEVGILSRNIVFQGSDNTAWHEKIEACEAGFDTGEFVTQTCFQGRFGEEMGSDQFGASIMLHAPRESALGTDQQQLAVAKVSNVEFTYCGQAFRLGRYPMHFHRNGNMSESYIKSCGIHKTFNRAVNIHGSHYVEVEGNVAYNIMGGAFFLEDGIETRNKINKNLVVFGRSSTSLLNEDITPAAFWITNPDNDVTNNRAAGGSHFGFWYRMHKHPDGPSYTRNVCPQNVPVGRFDGNVAHSQGWFGLWIFADYFPYDQGGACSNGNLLGKPTSTKFTNFFAWNCEKGAEAVDVGATQMSGFVLYNNEKVGYEQKMLDTTERFTDRTGLLENSYVIAHSTLNQADLPPPRDTGTSTGIINPHGQGWLIRNVTFINFDLDGSRATSGTSIDGTCGGHCGGYQVWFEDIKFVNSANKGRFRWTHDGVWVDVDGSLTGYTAGHKVVTLQPALDPDMCYNLTVQNAFTESGSEPAVICKPEYKFIRLALNDVGPGDLFKGKDLLLKCTHGDVVGKYEKHRMVYKFGWMLTVPSKETCTMEFRDAPLQESVSYKGTFYDLEEGMWLKIKTKRDTKPDRIKILKDEDQRNMTGVDHIINYNGDWTYDPLEEELLYLISYNDLPENRGKRAAQPAFKDFDVTVEFEKCLYKGCVAPDFATLTAPVDSRPEGFLLWSDPATWTTLEQNKPTAGANVMIPAGVWVVIDEQIPTLGNLAIYGGLEVDCEEDFELTAKYIFVRGRGSGEGHFTVGWPDAPYPADRLVTITLTGTQESYSDDRFTYPNEGEGPNPGSKGILINGMLDLHGAPSVKSWAQLSQTVVAGDQSIMVDGELDWKVGMKIVVASTGYGGAETEVHTIASIATSNGKTTIGTTTAFIYKHLGVSNSIPGLPSNHPYQSRTYEMRAEVGLLSRNVRIKGSDYAGLEAEGYGARVLVGVSASVEQDEEGTVRTVGHQGGARLSNVEFYHTGQNGFPFPWDPRFSLSFFQVDKDFDIRPQYLKDCAFHEGFSPAVGIFGTAQVVVQNNVFYRSVDHAVQIIADQAKIHDNMVAWNVHGGTYNGRNEKNTAYKGAIDASSSTGISMRGNHVSGAERTAFNLPHQGCTGTSADSAAWQNNVAHSSLSGAAIISEKLNKGTVDPKCNFVPNFYMWRCYDFGIYLQTRGAARIENCMFAENRAALYTASYAPGALSHLNENEKMELLDSVFIGVTEEFDRCPSDQPYLRAADQAPVNNCGFCHNWLGDSDGLTGWSIPLSYSSQNGAPEKPFVGAMSYNPVQGLAIANNIHFVGYSNKTCSNGDVLKNLAIESNPKSEDMDFPVELRGITSSSVENILYIHRPNVKKINQADCVDMDCDGKKKDLLKDFDGALSGSGRQSTIIADSAFEWDGDPRRGLGDYRVPKALLTDGNNNNNPIPRADIASNLGIIRNTGCVWREDWLAWVCEDLQHEVLVIESMDSDTETRRLSPVALVAYTAWGNYLDLINGPQDHGWCDGYTCQQRISTFHAVVANGYWFDVYFSSTSPQVVRLQTINTQPDVTIGIKVFYHKPQRLDVYYDNSYILPTNGLMDEQGAVSTPTTGTPPTLSDAGGANWFDKTNKLIYLILKGDKQLELRVSPVVILSLSLPAVTVDDFFGDNLVYNLAEFLGIPASRIKIVETVSESNRRKRSTEGTTVKVEISNPPQNDNSAESQAAREEGRASLINSTQTIVTSFQVGDELSEALNITLLGLGVEEPVPSPDDPAWNVTVDRDESGETTSIIRKPTTLVAGDTPQAAQEGAPFTVPPTFRMEDAQGMTVDILGSTADPWTFTATTLRKGDGSSIGEAQLLNPTRGFVNGWANFTDLAISHDGDDFYIDFTITYPPQAAGRFSATVGPLTVRKRQLTAQVSDLPASVSATQPFSLTVKIIDQDTMLVVEDLTWKGHTFTVDFSVEKNSYSGQFTGSKSKTFNKTGELLVTGLTLSEPGKAYLKLSVTTDPADADYSFHVTLDTVINVLPSTAVTGTITQTVEFRFAGDCTSLSTDDTVNIAEQVHNSLQPSAPKVIFDNYVISCGSIVVTVEMTGDIADFDESVAAILVVLRGLTLTVGGTTISAEKHLTVNGINEWTDHVEEKDDDGFPVWAIVIIVIVVLLLIGLVIGLVLWKVAMGTNKKTSSSVAPSKENLKEETDKPARKESYKPQPV